MSISICRRDCILASMAGSKKRNVPRPSTLGAVEREIGAFEQALGAGAVARHERDADAGADVEELAFGDVGSPDEVDDAPGKRLGIHRVGEARLENHELVAADACNGIGRAHRRAQAVGDPLEEHVAHRVAQRIVDRLEAVEVDQHDRAFLAAARVAAQRLV